MIGAVIQGVGVEQTTFDPIVYHQFGERSSVEMITDSCLAAAQLHKVVLAFPMSERKNLSGQVIGHKSKVNPLKREALSRTPTVSYYTPEEDHLTGLYMAALQNGLDHIVRVHANCPLIPTWLINRTVKFYFEQTEQREVVTTRDTYDKGFRIDVFPFWLLADAYVYQEERADMKSGVEIHTENNRTFGIPKVNYTLALESIEQAEIFDSIVFNIVSGHDIADILEDKDGDNKEDTQE